MLAVSGGVDSMVLFDVLVKTPGLELVAAHFDHGIRPDSDSDTYLVRSVAMSHNVLFETAKAELGPETSEDTARKARYSFLRHICKKHNADAIITAHHQDDVLETAIINLQRGTGWRGLASLRSTNEIIRPLLHAPKTELVAYAKLHAIRWREDSTNTDERYARNYIRHRLLTNAPQVFRQQMVKNIVRQNELATMIDEEIRQWLQAYTTQESRTTSLPRYQLVMLPQDVAHQALQTILRQVSGNSAQRPLVDRALLFAKVAKSGKVFQFNGTWQLRVTQKDAIVEPTPVVVS